MSDNIPTLAITQSDARLLQGVIEDTEAALGQNQDPKKRLEVLERLAHTSAQAVGFFQERILIARAIIQTEGLWRFARNSDGAEYESFSQYDVDFMKDIFGVQQRAAYARISKIEALAELGVSMQETAALVFKMPSITGKALELGMDSMTGEFVGLEPEVRKRMLDETGIVNAEGMTDQQIVSEYLRMLAAQPSHRDASESVDRVSGGWSRVMRWVPKERAIVVKWFKRGAPDSIEVRFKLDGEKPLPRQAKAWLDSMV